MAKCLTTRRRPVAMSYPTGGAQPSFWKGQYGSADRFGQFAVKIAVRRVYEAPGPDDGYRVLVDRLWPRGVRKADLLHDAWAKDLAPSNGLRKWVHADMSRWDAFCERYRAELAGQAGVVDELLQVDCDTLTLLYAARDEQRNHAVVLKEYLEARQRR